ncbi:MAG TPA: 1-acyl-sn-glycerol-3-phosphate acyltransferase [Gemmataceae bacterium]|nr:1-acyl-sn-glycerol-3-phosphate acyltransferase [Gemmataceae bacterium]
MQNIIVEKPYRFVPPYPGEIWTRLLRSYLPRYLRQTWGIAAAEIRGIEHVRESIRKGHGILLAPNHCRPSDPLVMGLVNVPAGRPIHTMASWHLFAESRFQTWLLRRIGAFSVFREGLDREALRAAIHILVEAKRPLVIFPEGVIWRANDRLGTLQEGVAFIARAAARQRAQATPPGQIVIHPVALKYFFEGDLPTALNPVLETIETRLSWRPQRQLPLLERICRVGEALLTLKEIEYLGRAQPGSHPQRLASLIDHLLGPLEKEWLNDQREPAVIERIKRLRSAIVPDLIAGKLSEEERTRRWRQLSDIYLAQQLAGYPADYLSERPTPERLLETVERFEEDLTDVAHAHGPLRVVIQLGPALEVSPARAKIGLDDPILVNLDQQLREMLQRLANEPR